MNASFSLFPTTSCTEQEKRPVRIGMVPKYLIIAVSFLPLLRPSVLVYSIAVANGCCMFRFFESVSLSLSLDDSRFSASVPFCSMIAYSFVNSANCDVFYSPSCRPCSCSSSLPVIIAASCLVYCRCVVVATAAAQEASVIQPDGRTGADSTTSAAAGGGGAAAGGGRGSPRKGGDSESQQQRSRHGSSGREDGSRRRPAGAVGGGGGGGREGGALGEGLLESMDVFSLGCVIAEVGFWGKGGGQGKEGGGIEAGSFVREGGWVIGWHVQTAAGC